MLAAIVETALGDDVFQEDRTTCGFEALDEKRACS